MTIGQISAINTASHCLHSKHLAHLGCTPMRCIPTPTCRQSSHLVILIRPPSSATRCPFAFPCTPTSPTGTLILRRFCSLSCTLCFLQGCPFCSRLRLLLHHAWRRTLPFSTFPASLTSCVHGATIQSRSTDASQTQAQLIVSPHLSPVPLEEQILGVLASFSQRQLDSSMYPDVTSNSTPL